MSTGQITASDIEDWNSLANIASSFEKRGLKPLPEISDDNRLVLELADSEFIELVQAGAGKSAVDYKPGSVTRHTNLVATDDFETFTFITRVRDWDAHGRIKYQQFSFEKEQFRRDSGEKQTVLQKLNQIEYGKSAAVMDDLYDTRKIVKEFYEQFESLRTDLVQEVDGIPDDRGNAKQRYVQVLLNRMIFLYFIQEKNLLDYDAEYLHKHHERIESEGRDVYDDFYEPLFFDLLGEGKNDPEFGKLPYLNGGLFSRNPIEEEFEDAKLGETTEKTNALFGRVLDFLSDWNWNVDERLDIVDPKNLSPAVLGHIFEQTVNQKEMGAYYTPEEITGFMARRTIHPYLLDQLNEEAGAEYEELDAVFGLMEMRADTGAEAIADGGTITQQAPTENVQAEHVETLCFDILQDMKVLDPAAGSGAFLLAAQEVLLDVYLQCFEYFQELDSQGLLWQVSDRTREALEEVEESKGGLSLSAKRQIILNNLYGVDIDNGAVEICKLRLWLSMVADIEDEPNEVEPLPNIDFNIRQGDSLLGFQSTEVSTNGQRLLITELLKDQLEDYNEKIEEYKFEDEPDSDLRNDLDVLNDKMQSQLDEWFTKIPRITVEHDVKDSKEVREVISESNSDIILKLKFASEIDDKLDEKLNELGFRTWKKAANLSLDKSHIRSKKIDDVFSEIRTVDVRRIFIERGVLKSDLEELDLFHWIMEFPEIYFQSDDEGFDVVLENPPYVRIETVEELKRDLYKDLHQTAKGRCDLYIPFIQRSFNFLSLDGRSGIITSNLFMKTEYGEQLRDYLPSHFGLESIYDFTSFSVFDDVTIYSTILIGSRETGRDIHCISVRSQEAVDEIVSNSFDWPHREDIVEFTLPADNLGADRWLILSEKERNAREKIYSKCGITLGNEDYFTVGSPLKTGQNTVFEAEVIAESGEKFEIKNTQLNGWVEAELWKRIIGPEHIERWSAIDPEVVIFFPYRHKQNDYELIDEGKFRTQYPKTYNLLLDYKQDLLNRKDSRRTWEELGRPWYSLAREGSPAYFEEDKILTDMTVKQQQFCLDRSSYLFMTGFIYGITSHKIDPHYLTGLLNTDALFAYLKPLCSPKNSGYIQIVIDHLLKLPIYEPDIDQELCTQISEVIEKYSEDLGELSRIVRQNTINEVVDVDYDIKKISTNMILVVSKFLINNKDQLKNEDIKSLEEINNHLSGIIFELSDEEIEALARI